MSKTLEEALEIYEAVAASSDLEVRAKGIYQALEGLMGEENIAAIATRENDYLRGRFSAGSLGTKMSQAGYNKLIKQIPLVDGENAYQESKKDGSKILKHSFFKYCGLSAQEWNERNASSRVYERLQKNIEVPPIEQIETAYKLLQSDNPWEIGVGLIAVSGRRPHEIVARGSFTKIEGEVYKVLFKGQGKKRGQEPEFAISLLIPVDFFLKAFKRFRANPDVKAVLNRAKTEGAKDTAKENRIIDKLSNKLLNRVVKAEFALILPSRSDTGDVSEDDEAAINNTALKSAYLSLATKRDCEGSPARQMLFAAKLAGHFIDIEPNDTEGLKRIDKELQHLLTTLGYMSYFVKDEVPFFNPQQDTVSYKNLTSVRLFPTDRQQLDEWQQLWGLTNQADVMTRVLELARQALATPQPTKKEETSPVDTTAVKELKAEVEAYQQRTDQKIDQILQLLQNQPSQQATEAIETIEAIAKRSSEALIAPEKPVEKPQPKQPSKDWEMFSKAELFGEGDLKPAKGTGATEERIRRAIEAMMAWNDQFPHDQNLERKWSINNRAVRDLAGVNGQAVKEWLEAHHQLVSDHNIKHGVTGDYHNRVHKAPGKTTKDLVLEEVYPLIK
jgi:hypothetical protein